ncbi:MAG: GNAT family N-acetyltransferase [Boseongicola sp.]
MPDAIRIGPAPPGFADWSALHALLVEAFAEMDGRIDPPSSLKRMTPEMLAEKANSEVLLLTFSGEELIGCGFGAPKADALHLSKLAVLPAYRGRGVLRRMIERFAEAANVCGLRALTLQTRIELTKNHSIFKALGFKETSEARHPGYNRTTSLIFRKPV